MLCYVMSTNHTFSVSSNSMETVRIMYEDRPTGSGKYEKAVSKLSNQNSFCAFISNNMKKAISTVFITGM